MAVAAIFSAAARGPTLHGRGDENRPAANPTVLFESSRFYMRRGFGKYASSEGGLPEARQATIVADVSANTLRSEIPGGSLLSLREAGI
jgi:hypothetical protein